MAPVAAVQIAEAATGRLVDHCVLLVSPQTAEFEEQEVKRGIAAVTRARIAVRRLDVASASDVGEVLKALLDDGPPDATWVFDGTAGNTAVTAAMVTTAAGEPDRVLVTCTDARRRLRSVARTGLWPVPLTPAPFPTVLAASYEQVDEDAPPEGLPRELVHVARTVTAQVVRETGGWPVQWWTPDRMVGVGGVDQLQLLMVTAADRLVCVAQAPDHVLYGTIRTVSDHRTVADLAATASAYADAIAGDAAGTLVVFRRRPGETDRVGTAALRKKIERRLTLAHPAEERLIRLCLFDGDGQSERAADQIIAGVARGLYRAPAVPETAPA